MAQRPVPAEQIEHIKRISHRRPKDRRPVGGRVDEPPAPPPSFDPRSVEIWYDYMKPLVESGIYDRVDYQMVEVAVTCHRTLERVRERLRDVPDGALVSESARGFLQAHPLLSAEREAATALRHALAELGRSPVSRMRLPKREAPQVGAEMASAIGTPPRLTALPAPVRTRKVAAAR